MFVIESILKGTAGHILLDLKVVKSNYKDIKFSDSLKRHLLDIIDYNFFGIPAIICIKYTALNQRLGDMIAHTIVINEEEELI